MLIFLHDLKRFYNVETFLENVNWPGYHSRKLNLLGGFPSVIWLFEKKLEWLILLCETWSINYVWQKKRQSPQAVSGVKFECTKTDLRQLCWLKQTFMRKNVIEKLIFIILWGPLWIIKKSIVCRILVAKVQQVTLHEKQEKPLA